MSHLALRIANVERCRVRIPLQGPSSGWNGTYASNWSFVEVLRVSTDDPDVIGYGETLVGNAYSASPTEAWLERAIGQKAIDVFSTPDLPLALQMAMLDILGKCFEVPAHKFLGLPQVRSEVAISWWSTSMSPADLGSEIESAVASGHIFHKVKARPWFDIHDQLKVAASVAPDRYRIGLDWNETLLDAKSAIEVLAPLDDIKIVDMHETPIRFGDFVGVRQIRQSIRRRVVEHYRFAGEIQPFVSTEGGPFDGYVLQGDVPTILNQGRFADVVNLPSWIQMVGTGLTTALAIQLSAVLRSARLPLVTGYNVYSDDLIVDPLVVDAGMVKVPQASGLGVQCDEASIARLSVGPDDTPEKRRAIWHVNWKDGRRWSYASREKLMEHFLSGQFDVRERGTWTEIEHDDSSAGFGRRYLELANVPKRTS